MWEIVQWFWLEQLCDGDVRVGKETFEDGDNCLGSSFGGAVSTLCCIVVSIIGDVQSGLESTHRSRKLQRNLLCPSGLVGPSSEVSTLFAIFLAMHYRQPKEHPSTNVSAVGNRCCFPRSLRGF